MTQALAGKRVLVVEDDALVALVLEAILDELGCVLAGSADRVDTALALIEGGLQTDVALLDVNLAGEAVFPVAAALKAAGVPFVFASGYGAAGLTDEWRDRPMMQKPYVEDAVRAALIQALDFRTG